MSLLTSRINLPIPGGWAKDGEQGQAEDNLAAGIVGKSGEVVDDAGKPVAKITKGEAQDLIGNVVTSTGEIVGKDGNVLGKAVPLNQDSKDSSKGGLDVGGTAKGAVDAVGDTAGQVTNSLGVGSSEKNDDKAEVNEEQTNAAEGIDLQDREADTKDLPNGETDNDVQSKVDDAQGQEEKLPEDVDPPTTDQRAPAEQGDVPEQGDVADQGDVAEKGDVADQGDVTEQGDVADQGDVAEQAQSEIPNTDDIEEALPAPFETFPGAKVNEEGKIIYDDKSIGAVVEGDAEQLAGMSVDEEGNIKGEDGDVIGKAELKDEIQEELKDNVIDISILKGAKVNKAGNLVNDKGEAIGRIKEGILKHLIGRKADENGQIWNDNGKVIGKAEPIPETEREELKEGAPFEDFPGATVESNGDVTYNGEVIGKVVDGDPKKLKGKKVDDDGDILDRNGNTIGKAERWEAEEAQPEPEADRSILAGKRVNKAGNVVDSHGQIFGRIVEGDAKKLAGRMCDKDGNVRSESGDIIGKAEVVPEGEREGFKEGPFAELPGCTVSKDGKVVTPSGDVVGRLISGDAKVLFGRAVDDDGDILDRNGNSIGKAERWEEPVKEKDKNAMSGRKVNREGNVVDADGNLIGKLTTGELSICSGKEIDDDGDVVDSKGKTIGHVSLLADIPKTPEPTETAEEKEKRETAEQDKKLAKQMAGCIEQCLEKIRPICKMITEKIEKAERTPKEDLDEEDLVKQVRPLIEEGSRILQESNGIIRGLDPDGHIQANAKHKSASREATPEEHHLADVLKELTGTVTKCIDDAKKKIEDMPHAKKELNPLWGLLTEPLFQILAAVGLLLNGVLELVGRLLSGLGLGGLVNNILGGLGITNVLKGLGVGGVVTALTGKNQKDKKK